MWNLKLRFPETVEVAVFVDCDRLSGADADLSFGLVLEVNPDAAVLGFDIDEADVMFRRHGMWFAADLYKNLAVAYPCN